MLFKCEESSCVYTPMAECDQSLIDQLHMVQLYDNSVVTCVVTQGVATIRRCKADNTCIEYRMPIYWLRDTINIARRHRTVTTKVGRYLVFTFVDMPEGIEISMDHKYHTILPREYWDWILAHK